MNVLVVDDHRDNRIILSRMIELAGHHASFAVDGSDALTRIRSGPAPDLVLMDLAMPRLDGWETTRALKRDPSTRRIPIIAVTGHVTTDEIQRALAAGADDLVSKPVDYHVLVAKIDAVLRGFACRASRPSAS